MSSSHMLYALVGSCIPLWALETTIHEHSMIDAHVRVDVVVQRWTDGASLRALVSADVFK